MEGTRRDTRNQRDVMPLLVLHSPKGVPGTGLSHSPREGGWRTHGAAALCGEGVVLWGCGSALSWILHSVKRARQQGGGNHCFLKYRTCTKKVFRSASSNLQHAKDWCSVHFKDEEKRKKNSHHSSFFQMKSFWYPKLLCVLMTKVLNNNWNLSLFLGRKHIESLLVTIRKPKKPVL